MNWYRVGDYLFAEDFPATGTKVNVIYKFGGITTNDNASGKIHYSKNIGPYIKDANKYKIPLRDEDLVRIYQNDTQDTRLEPKVKSGRIVRGNFRRITFGDLRQVESSINAVAKVRD